MRPTPAVALSPRESEVARLVAEGLTNAAIGARLRLSRDTVQSYVQRIYSKLGVRGRAALVRWWTLTRRRAR